MREKLISESKKKIDHSKLDKIQKDLEKQRIAGIKKKAEISQKQSTASKLGLEINLQMPKPKDILVMTNSMYVLKKAKFNNIATLESLYNSTQNKKLKENGAQAVFHYLSLHSSEYYKDKHDGRDIPNCDRYADRLVRLPLFYELGESNIEDIKILLNN